MLRVNNDRANSKNYQVIFGGLDARRGAGDGTIAAMKNLSSDEYPLVSPRAKRYTVHTYTGNINGYLCHDGHEFICAGNYLYADGKVYDYSLSSKEKSMAVVSGKLMIWPDKVYFDLRALTAAGMYESIAALNAALEDVPESEIEDNIYLAKGDDGKYRAYRSGGKDDPDRIWDLQYDVIQKLEFKTTTTANILLNGKLYGERAENNCILFSESDAVKIHDSLRVGDAVEVSGCEKNKNNNKTAVIRDLEFVQQIASDGITIEKKLFVYFDENCFAQDPWYYTYTSTSDMSADGTTYCFKVRDRWVCFHLPKAVSKGTEFRYNTDNLTAELRGLFMRGSGEGTDTRINYTYGNLPLTSVNSPTVELDFIASLGRYTEESNLSISRTVPDLEAIFEHDNRLWGCKGSEIYCSKLGDPINFYVYEGLSTDAWFVDVGGDGDFTGGCSYLGRPTFFKENAIYKVYGTKPSNYETSDTMTLGVESGSGKSLAIAGETLFYLSRHGVVAYNGGVPSVISAPLGLKKFKNAVGGSDGLKYYVSMMSGSTAGLYVYDTQKRLWHREDDLNADGFGWHEGALRAATRDKKVLTVSRAYDAPIGSTAETAVDWELITNWIVENSPEKKTISKIHIRMDMEAGSSADIYIDYNNGKGWKLVNQLNGEKAAVSTDRLRSFYLPVIPERCDNFRLKMTGTGWFALYSLAIEYYDGSGY